MIYRTEHQCRCCGGRSLREVIAFGETPLADRLLTEAQLADPEPMAPLTLARCPDCSLVQIRETVDPEILFFAEYPYFSSVSPALCRHFAGNAAEVMRRKPLGPDTLVMEAASNDGCLLRNFAEKGIRVLGIDPCEAPVLRARGAGIPTDMEFFGTRKAAQLAADGLFADVFLANNVLAHVADLRGFVGGIARVLKPDGLAVLEMPYLADLVAHCEFDTIYHQHLCYFSATSLARLFADAGLHLNDVQRIPIHGGSLRVFVGKSPARSPAVKALLQQEQSAGVADGSFLADFRDRIEVVRRELSALLRDLKASGKRIAGYGAAGKATTLLAWCGIDRSLLDYVADLNPYKHGKYMGGGRLPIVAVERIHEDQPDAVLILAWNFAGEIMRQLDDYRRAGGSFIIPIPRPRMAGGNPPQ